MSVILDEKAETSRRLAALESLWHPWFHLKDGPRVKDLIDLYGTLDSQELREAVLDVLIKSEDRRALKVFHDVLHHERNDLVRWFAAKGLANWNIRSGVAELMRLLGSNAMLDEGHPLFREVQKSLTARNERKGWGFPIDALFRDIERLSTDAEKDRLYATRWKEWFAANKERFPEWTPEKERDTRNDAQPEDSLKDRNSSEHTTP